MSWAIMVLVALFASLLVWLAARSTHNPDERLRGRQVAYTARLSLALPVTLFLAVTLGLWVACYDTVKDIVPADVFYVPFFLHDKDTTDGKDFLLNLILVSATPVFLLSVALVGIAVGLTGWALFPAVWAELRSPDKNDSARSKRLGQWITRGYKLMRGAGEIIFVTAFVIFPIGILLVHLNLPDYLRPVLSNDETNQTFLRMLMGAMMLLGVPAMGALFRGQMGISSSGVRHALTIALDIDAYLREHPRDYTPRARISARYVSLLRYLCHWTNPLDEKGYDAMIIVAHSQGTVITADLLRFLKSNPDPELKKIPLYQLTLGCPLRQIYAARFPHLYQWAAHTQAYHMTKPDSGDIPPQTIPLPNELGLTRWVNAFRSGDYVGRFLWRSNISDHQWDPCGTTSKDVPWSSRIDQPENVSTDDTGAQEEFCLGVGAHTHYFDETGRYVASALDSLIQEAASNHPGGPAAGEPPVLSPPEVGRLDGMAIDSSSTKMTAGSV